MKLAVLGLVLLGVACGDNTPRPPATPDAPGVPDAPTVTTPASFCRAFSERICAGLDACACRFDQRAYDAAGCVDARTADCAASFGAKVGPDLAAGHARFDEAVVASCLAATDAMVAGCVLGTGPSAPLPAACNAIILATAIVGQPCELTGGGLAFCGATGEGVCVPSETGATCTALPGAGEACPYDLCAAGLACDGGTCAAPAALGAACQVSAACATGLICDPTLHCAAPLGATAACDASAQCQAGLACDQGACTALAALGDGCDGPPVCGAQRSCGRAPETRTCTDPDASGDPCMTDTCADGLTCASSSPMTCVALPLAGEACLDGYACAAGLTCIDGVGTCAPLPGVGQTCAAGSRFCADGLGCRSSDNTCQPGPGSGQECLLNPPDYVCGAGLGCDFGMTGSTCIALGGAGAACNTDRTCAVGTYCELSTLQCAARLPDGASCNDGNECLVGHECAVRPGGPTCQPIPARDQPCVYDCTSGLRCQGLGGQCVRELCVIPG